MKVLLDIKDGKADFVMELLKNFSFVNAETLTPYKAGVLKGIKEAVDELKMVKAGKIKARNAIDLIDEL
jgi:hypothetical protein